MIQKLLYSQFIALFFAIFCLPINGHAAEITVQAAVERQEAYVGEPIAMQIQIKGHDAPLEPDLSLITDFTIRFRGGQQNSSTSITNINGQWSKISSQGYIFNYTIIPRKAGNLTFPAIGVILDNKTYQTRPFSIHARKPVETDDFKLRLHLSQDQAYVGEPVVMTTTWYIGKEVKGFDYSLPILDDPRFEVVSRVPPTISQNDFEIPLGKSSVTARRGQDMFEGQSYTTLSFEHTLIPRQPGEHTLAQATVSCQAMSGFDRSRQRGRSPFGNDDLFNSFFNQGVRKTYRTVITPSNEPSIIVLPLPVHGQPSSFSGLVGNYTLLARAEPVDVNVGDPITLTLSVSGPFVNAVQLPSLAHLSAAGFRIPEEISPGEMDGESMIFTQTIRATHDKMNEIPAVELSFFNPRSKKYETARSNPIAISVQPTRIITAQDAVGGEVQQIKTKLQAREEGINFNYDDPTVLTNRAPEQSFSDTSWLLLLVGPPASFLVLLGTTTFIGRRHRDPQAMQARKAFGQLKKMLNSAPVDSGVSAIALALKTYLGHKLRRPAGAITFLDVEPQLAASGVGQQTLQKLGEILEHCEAYQYTGGAGYQDDLSTLKTDILDVSRQLEDVLS